ncbi:uncharacterized protein LOC129224188 [Uloborus diversus]|uniref:uncharacterized protein LOC129224188 n=1 Tax=Uloborus diversus TaxID=327109 RepID=UPI00240A8A17|nr:uncharacterized protein LOC129224188 [Uloborus diversus]
MKLLFCAGFLLAISAPILADPPCHMSELMGCVQIGIDWLHSLPPKSIPETEQDVDAMCTEITKAFDCAIKFRESCMTPLEKEVVLLVVEGALDLQKDFCTKGSASRGKYMTHSVCLNKVSHMEEIKTQIEYLLAVLENARNVKATDAVNYGCCGYRKFYNSFLKLTTDTCGKEAVDATQELISAAVAQLPDVACSGYTGEEDKCKAILPPEGSKPSSDANGTQFYKFIRDILKNWLD